MQKVTLKNKQSRMLGLGNGVCIAPGKTVDINKDEFDRLKEGAVLKSWFRLGYVACVVSGNSAPEELGVEVVTEEPEAPAVTSDLTIDTMNVDQGKMMIAATSNVSLLHEWYASEKRKGVKKAIEERLTALDTGADTPEA